MAQRFDVHPNRITAWKTQLADGAAGRREDTARQIGELTLTSPCENGYVEPFNVRLRDELLGGEVFYSLGGAQVIIESWRRHYNTIRAPRRDRLPARQHQRCS